MMMIDFLLACFYFGVIIGFHRAVYYRFWPSQRT